MKVFAPPAEVALEEPDYRNYDRVKENAKIDRYQRSLKVWLTKAGYTGKRTGDVVRFQVADGYAEYMLADGKKAALVHLPFGDAYSYPDVKYLPKAEILKRIDADKRMAALFAERG